MKMKLNLKSILKKIILIIVGIYLVITFVKQQKKIKTKYFVCDTMVTELSTIRRPLSQKHL